MSEWNEYSLGDVCDITSSRRIFLNEYSNSGVPFFRSKEIIEKAKGNSISTELYITQERYDEIKKRNFVPVENDILITSVGTLGVSYLVSSNDYFYFKDGNLTWLRSFSDCVFPKYLLYWLRSPLGKEKINEISIGSTQPAITIQGLRGLKLKIPPLALQKTTAEILSFIDDKIELNIKINQELEVLTQTLFKQWFIDFEFPNENGEPYKSSGGEMVDSELGEIPKGLDVVKVASLKYKLQTGTRPKGGVGGITNGMPSIGAESVKGLGYYDFTKIKYVSNEFASKMKRGKVEGYELLIYKDGGKPGTFIPHFTMFGEGFPFETFYINEHVFLLDFFDKKFNSFCYFFFDSPYVKPVFENNGGKAAIPGINQEDVKELYIFHPQNDLIKQFGEFAKSSITTILKNCKENESLRSLRDTLLPKLISGELKINEITN